MSSVVDICNLALSNLGKVNIQSLLDPSAEAAACNQFYAITRDMLLQAHPWGFAGKSLVMAQVNNDKPGRWGFAYARPVDCLKVRWLRPQYTSISNTTGIVTWADYLQYSSDNQYGERSSALLPEWMAYPYDLEAQTIYTDVAVAVLRYTYQLTDTTQFSPLFVDALSWHLATRLAMPLTRDPKVRSDAFTLAQHMQAIAEAADANEVRNDYNNPSELITGRS